MTHWLRRLLLVEDEERGITLAAAGYFFCLLATFFVLRPLRDAFGVQDAGRLARLFLWTFACVLLAWPCLAWVVGRHPRRRAVPIVYRFVQANLLVFFALLLWSGGETRANAVRVLFVWLSVFNLIGVTLFWGFMADVFRPEQAKRLYGAIGVGGTAGALSGSALTDLLAPRIGPMPLFLLCILLLEGALLCIRFLDRRCPVDPAREAANSQEWREQGIAASALTVVRSPYFLAIAGYVLLYSLFGTLTYNGQMEALRGSGLDEGARTAFQARINWVQNGITVVLQLLITGRLLRRIGVGWGMGVQAMVAAAVLGLLAGGPVLGMFFWASVAGRTSHFAVAKPAQEALYTVVARVEKYRAKTFLDTVVYRGGDALASLLYETLRVSMGFAQVALAILPATALWLVLGLLLGRWMEARSRARTAANA